MQRAAATASITGLDGWGAMVRVGPPLFCKGPRSGSTPTWSPLMPLVSPLQALALPSRLYPSEMRLPWQSEPVPLALPARMVLVRGVDSLVERPPPAPVAVLPLTVPLVRLTVPLVLYRPPPEVAVLPLTVLLASRAVAALSL